MDLIATIITALITAFVTLSGTILFYRENKGSKKGDAITNLMATMTEMAEGFKETQRSNNKYVSELLNTIDEKNMMYKLSMDKIDTLIKESKERDLKIANLERVNRGLEKKIGELMQTKDNSEMYYCTNKECELRKPKFGTYKSNEQ